MRYAPCEAAVAYSTQSDVEKAGITPAQLVQLTDDNQDGLADADVLTENGAQADAEIDGYLGGRYTVPVTPVPALIRNCSVAIRVWKLYGRRGMVNERRRQDYEDAVAKLKALATGTMVLPATGGGEVATDASDQPEASRSPEDRTFTIGKKSTGDVGSLDNF